MFEMREAVTRRIARLVAGTWLLLGAAQLVAWFVLVDTRLGPIGVSFLGGADSALSILATSWFLAIASYGVVWVGLRVWSPRWATTSFPLWFETLSLAVPAAGVGLLAPLMLHVPIVLTLASAGAFESWAYLSIFVVGIAHLVFATLISYRARQVVLGRTPMIWPKLLAITIVAASIPWVVLIGIPPFLVGITGLVLTPALTRWMDREGARDRAEREALAGWEAVPRATIVTRGHSAA